MATPPKVKRSGSWANIAVPYARVSNSWKPCKQIWSKVGGSWKIVFDITAEETFSGTGTLDSYGGDGGYTWQVPSGGTVTMSSGNATASAVNTVAGIETGFDGSTNAFSVEVDASDSSTSGQGVSFWIQDQSNWWGVQSYFEAYTYKVPASTTYNWDCYTRSVTSNNYGAYYAAPCYYYATVNYGANANGRYTAIWNRYCSPNNRRYVGTNAYQYLGCVGGCYYDDPGPGVYCTATKGYNNCGPVCADGCSCPGAYTSYAGTNCGQGAYNYYAYNNAAPNCSCYVSIYYTFASTYYPGGCTVNYGAYGAVQRYNSSNAATYGNYSYPNCGSGNQTNCSPMVTTIDNSYYVNSIYKRTRVVKRVAGTYSTVTDGADLGASATVGNINANISGNTITVQSYASAAKAGTAHPSYTSTATGATKTNKHGIMVGTGYGTAAPFTGTPASTQGYNITRFKVNV